MKTYYKQIIGSCLLASGLSIFSAISSITVKPASAVQLFLNFASENDCAGYFGGTGGTVCQIFGPNAEGQNIKISPVIAKFDTSDPNSIIPSTATYINNHSTQGFPSIDGTEWNFGTQKNKNKTGTWTYTRGTNDPGIRYWVAKGGNGFNLFWEVDSADTITGGACETISQYFTLDCLSKAKIVTTGTWSTPNTPNGNNQTALSHITFYDSKQPVDSGPSEIPEPGTTLGLGLFALGGLRLLRKRN